MKPIKPEFDLLIDEAIKYINQKLSEKHFTDRFTKPDDEWYAIILAPYHRFTPVMDDVVKRFKKDGWDCSWSAEYDARGPWHSFLVNKKYFKGVGISMSCSPYGLGQTFYNEITG